MARNFTEDELQYFKSNPAIIYILETRYRLSAELYWKAGEKGTSDELMARARQVWDLFEPHLRETAAGLPINELTRLQKIFERQRHGDKKTD